MRTRTGHQFAGHVVDGDGVLVLSGVVVALVGDVDHSGGLNIVGELFPLRALLCRLVSFKFTRRFRTHGLLGFITEDRCRVLEHPARFHTLEDTVLPYQLLRTKW